MFKFLFIVFVGIGLRSSYGGGDEALLPSNTFNAQFAKLKNQVEQTQETLQTDLEELIQLSMKPSPFAVAHLECLLSFFQEHRYVLTDQQRNKLLFTVNLMTVVSPKKPTVQGIEDRQETSLSNDEVRRIGQQKILAGKSILKLKIWDLSDPSSYQTDKQEAVHTVLANFRQDINDLRYLYSFFTRHPLALTPLCTKDILEKICVWPMFSEKKAELIWDLWELHTPPDKQEFKKDLLEICHKTPNFSFFEAFIVWLKVCQEKLHTEQSEQALATIKKLGLNHANSIGFLTFEQKLHLIQEIHKLTDTTIGGFKDLLEPLLTTPPMYLSFLQASLEWLAMHNQKLSETTKTKVADTLLQLQLHQDIDEARKKEILKNFYKIT